MAPGDPSAADCHEAVLYALFLSLMPGKALTPTVIDQHAAHLADLDREGKLVLAGPLEGPCGGRKRTREPPWNPRPIGRKISACHGELRMAAHPCLRSAHLPL
jgi:hypothetical protein